MKALERVDLLGEIATSLQGNYSTTQINALLRSLDIKDLEEAVSSKRVYAQEKLATLDDAELLALAEELDIPLPEGLSESSSDPMLGSERTVFVIHGRDEQMRAEFFSFLRAAGLDPLEWSEAVKLTGKGAPYIGEILDHAFEEAAAVVVLLTPDDVVRLSEGLVRSSDGPEERELRLQPRPNVLFEAGMAFGRYPERTILVSVGDPKQFSDVAGRHVVRLSDEPEKRLDLLQRLETAGCDVRSADRRDWLTTGNFELEPRGIRAKSRGDGGSTERSEDILNDTRIEALQIVAGSGGIDAADVGHRLGISPVEAQHHLETLEEHGYLHGQYAIGRDPRYVLGKKGRAYLVEEGLV